MSDTQQPFVLVVGSAERAEHRRQMFRYFRNEFDQPRYVQLPLSIVALSSKIHELRAAGSTVACVVLVLPSAHTIFNEVLRRIPLAFAQLPIYQSQNSFCVMIYPEDHRPRHRD